MSRGERREKVSVDLDDLVCAVGKDQDPAAFAALFRHFAPRLKAYFMRQGAGTEQAEEVVQEAMLMVWRRAATFNPAQSSAATWIFTIARNKRIDALRRERKVELDPDDPALAPAPIEDAESIVDTQQRSDRLRAALATLPTEQARLVQLSYYDGKPHGTISAEIDVPLGTVKSRLRLAVDRLRRALEETG